MHTIVCVRNCACLYVRMYCAYVSYYRVTQVLGFDKDDMVGQKIFDFFHPKEYYQSEHFVCWKKC